jgi:hypothetical protein
LGKKKLLSNLRKLKNPVVVDGGHWQFGHTYFVMTGDGVMTMDCTAFDPVFGPFIVSQPDLDLAKKKAEGKDVLALAGDSVLKTEEALLILNNMSPEMTHWAYIPYEDAPLADWNVSKNYSDIEMALADDGMNMELEIELWDEMDEDDLSRWREEL